MSHNIGRVVSIAPQRVGPDTGQPPNSGSNWELAFTPQNALTGGPPRFVILHLTALALPGGAKVEVELGYGKDVITPAAGAEAWSRPVDPKLGPIVVRFVGAAGGATIAEYGSGEPWFTDYPAGSELFESTCVANTNQRRSRSGWFASVPKMLSTSPERWRRGLVRWNAWPSRFGLWAMWSSAWATKSTGTMFV